MGDKLTDNSTDKLNIILCDLVYDYLGTGTFSFPLNIGYLKSYTYQMLPGQTDISLVKFPRDFLRLLENEKPDVVGFAHYTWNAELNRLMASMVRRKFPQAMIVFGGPNLTIDDQGIREFRDKYGAVDFYVPFQGETPFVDLIQRRLSSDSVSALKNQAIPGVISFLGPNADPIMGEWLPRMDDPGIIESPYLSGVLDEFFDTRLIPIVETNRGCPYTCTFCAQGLSSYNRMEFFPLERIHDEIQYIAGHVKNTNILLFADSNFGIHPRDIKLSEYIGQMQKDHGYPRRVSMNWAKNQPKILDIALALGQTSHLTISLQSIDEGVLKNVKRKNISTDTFKSIVDRVNHSGGRSGTEIILGLPGESRESHLNTLRTLFDWNVSDIIAYNCLVLDGTEMDRQRNEYGITTKFRLSDGCYGEYNGHFVADIEEGVMSTKHISNEELLSFRQIHWLIWFMWNYRFYYDFLKLFLNNGINPLDVIFALTEKLKNTDGDLGNVMRMFYYETYAEWHDSPEALQAYYAQPDNLERLLNGKLGGKLNSKYMWRILLESHTAFRNVLRDTAIELASTNNIPIDNALIEQMLDYQFSRILDFSVQGSDFGREVVKKYDYDFISWATDGYPTDIDQYKFTGARPYRFYMSDESLNALKKLIAQYHHDSSLVMYRKMVEFMQVADLFYSVDIMTSH
jgi:radical SAM superfamily enzyme YgiQ (UPF0313 family)